MFIYCEKLAYLNVISLHCFGGTEEKDRLEHSVQRPRV